MFQSKFASFSNSVIATRSVSCADPACASAWPLVSLELVCNKPSTAAQLKQPHFEQLQALVLFRAGAAVLIAAQEALLAMKSLVYFGWQPDWNAQGADFKQLTLALPPSVKALVLHAPTWCTSSEPTTGVPQFEAPGVEIFAVERAGAEAAVSMMAKLLSFPKLRQLLIRIDTDSETKEHNLDAHCRKLEADILQGVFHQLVRAECHYWGENDKFKVLDLINGRERKIRYDHEDARWVLHVEDDVSSDYDRHDESVTVFVSPLSSRFMQCVVDRLRSLLPSPVSCAAMTSFASCGRSCSRLAVNTTLTQRDPLLAQTLTTLLSFPNESGFDVRMVIYRVNVVACNITNCV